ncbi:MAG: glycerol-3-phosphate acyltransferase [Olsenella sp.]|jgi:glycerol-3-phosphate acyltransferase PlsY
MEVLVCLLVGYACGNLLTAEIVARRELGRSAFDVGVGNPGMANMGHELGLRAAALTLAGDLGKVVVATVVCSLAFPQLGSAAAAWAGLGCTLGHNFPAWHRFRGGKGVATTCATIVLASPGWGIASLLVGLAAVVLSGYLCVGAIAIAASYALLMLLAGDLAHAVVALALLALMVLAHGSAVAGIRDGSTPRASLAEKVRSLLPFDLPGAYAHAGAAHAGAGVHAAADKDPGSRRPPAGAGAPGRSASGGFFTRGSLSLDALLHGSSAGDDAARRVRSRVGKVSPGDTLAYPRVTEDATSADATPGPASFSPTAGDAASGYASFSPTAGGATPEASAAGEVAPVAASPQQAAPAIPSAPTQAAPAQAPFAPGAPAQATVAVDKTVAMPRVVAAPAAGGPVTPSDATRRRIRTEAADTAPRVRQDATTRRAQVVRAQATDQVRPMIPAIEVRRMASQQRLHHEQQAAAEEIVRIGHFVGEGARAAGKGLAQAGSAAARALGRAQAASADELERRRTLERRRASAASRGGSLTQRPSTEGHGPSGSRTPLEHASRPRPTQGQGARQGQGRTQGQQQGQAARATRSQRPQVGRGPVRDARPSRATRAPQPTAEHARPKHARYPEQGQGSHGSQDARHPQQHEAHQAHAPRHRS